MGARRIPSGKEDLERPQEEAKEEETVEVIDFNGFLRWCAQPHMGLPWLKPRYGQSFFNNLSSAKPGLAEHLRGHILDPFHFEVVRPEVLAWVESHWDTPDSDVQSLDSLLPSE